MTTQSDSQQTWLEAHFKVARISQQDLADRLRAATGEPWDQAKVSRYLKNPDKAPMGSILAMLRELGVDSPLAALSVPIAPPNEGIDAGAPGENLRQEMRTLASYVRERDWWVAGEAGSGDAIETRRPYDPENLLIACEGIAQKPYVGLFGKFDVGKSTLINTILGSKYLPTSYQPATRVITYVRHIEDRPTWLQEEVLMLGDGFEPSRWQEEEHCRENKIVAGSFGTLHAHGTHQGDHAESSDAKFALVYVDAPLLRSCSIIDLPGTENNASDTRKAEAAEVQFDVAIFADTAQGFLADSTLLRLGAVVRRLPVVEAEGSDVRPMSNLFVVATHAHAGITDQEINEQILPGGLERAWRQLGETALTERSESSGRVITREDFQECFLAFDRDNPSRRDALFTSLRALLADQLPVLARRTVHQAIEEFKQDASEHVSADIETYQSAIYDQAAVREELKKLEEAEPHRERIMALSRKNVEASISAERKQTGSELRQYLSDTLSPDKIEGVIRKKFDDKKDAQKNAAALILEKIQDHTERDLKRRSERVSKDVSEFLEQYEQATLAGRPEIGSVHIPFNAKGAFAGGLVGLAGVGGLAVWASTLGNLGAYILVSQAVGVASALGISTGGTAVWTSAVAAIGGPVSIAIGIVVIAGLLGWALLRGSWQKRLAKEIAKALQKQDIQGTYLRVADDFWKDTAEGFAQGAKATEKAWQQHLAELRDLSSEDKLAELQLRLERLRDISGFLDDVPWPAPSA